MTKEWNATLYHQISAPQVSWGKKVLSRITLRGDERLLDFPCRVDGEIVLLCWKLGEEKITHWHSPEEGFAGRKPIDERIERAGKKKGSR